MIEYEQAKLAETRALTPIHFFKKKKKKKKCREGFQANEEEEHCGQGPSYMHHESRHPLMFVLAFMHD